MCLCVLSGSVISSRLCACACMCPTVLSDHVAGRGGEPKAPGPQMCDPVSEGSGGAAMPASVSVPRGHEERNRPRQRADQKVGGAQCTVKKRNAWI